MPQRTYFLVGDLKPPPNHYILSQVPSIKSLLCHCCQAQNDSFLSIYYIDIDLFVEHDINC